MKMHTMYGSNTITDTSDCKICKGDDYNFIFDKRSGFFMRWGKTKNDDPQWSPIGPEILDIEIVTQGCSLGCKFCYKDNTNSEPVCMSFETYKDILDKMPQTLTQVAFGITDLKANPEFFKMMEYTKSKGIIPNFTMTGIDLTDELADETARLCGAVAISAYQGKKDLCYDTVKKMTDKGMDQVNIHVMVSEESIDFVYEVLNDTKNDQRLEKLNAVVFLGLKPKGRAKDHFTPLCYKKFGDLFSFSMKNDMRIGFDSCSAPKFEKAVSSSVEIDEDKKERMIQMSESCESCLFSSYISTEGMFYPCSFMEKEGEWKEGVSVINSSNFLKDVWLHPKVEVWRKKLLENSVNGCRRCLAFPEINE